MTPKHVTLAALAGAATLVLATAARGADAPKRTPELVEQGRAAFAKYCASCHGPRGEGDGPAAKALKPPPRNLITQPPKGGAPEIFRVLESGVKGTAMIAFKHPSQTDRWAIAYYVDGLKDAKK